MRSPSAPPEPSERPARASLIAGRYCIEAAIGKGGVAQVFRVADASQRTRLALKRLRSDVPPPLQALFETEYQTLASLRHPHTVEVYEYARPSGTAEFIDRIDTLLGSAAQARADSPELHLANSAFVGRARAASLAQAAPARGQQSGAQCDARGRSGHGAFAAAARTRTRSARRR
jgi:hypothetical protein